MNKVMHPIVGSLCEPAAMTVVFVFLAGTPDVHAAPLPQVGEAPEVQAAADQDAAVEATEAAEAEDTTAPPLIELLSGFDAARIESAAQWLDTPQDDGLIGEVARLLFQVNRLRRNALAPPPATDQPEPGVPATAAIGEAVTLRGIARQAESVELPESLAEVIDFERIYRVELRVQAADQAAEDVVAAGDAESPAERSVSEGSGIDSERSVWVMVTSIPAAWSAAAAGGRQMEQSVGVRGIVARTDPQGRPEVIAAPAVAWYPRADREIPEDWALLGEHRFDVSLLEGVRSRDRRPLTSEDHEAFYAMLRTSAAIDFETPAPRRDAAELLRDSWMMVGSRIRIGCQSVRVTRVSIDNPQVRRQVGSDHYWQLDALGDLGDVVIKIEPLDPAAEPATFHNRYPISIVSLTLPEFLERRVGEAAGAQAVRGDVALISRRLIVDGFYYRMWSYESEFMDRHGGGGQFGPLIMATRIIDDELPAGDWLGVARLGYIAAAVVVLVILATAFWVYRTERKDAAARARLSPPPESPEWPEEL